MVTEVTPNSRTDNNTYNYDNNSLSGPGTTEALVRQGYIANEAGLHTPRNTNVAYKTARINSIPSSLDVTKLPENQVINGFDKRKVIIWETKTPTGRELLSYDGYYYIEILKGFDLEAQLWAENRIKSGDTNFQRREGKGRYLFILSTEASRTEYTNRGLDLNQLRNVYDGAEDLTPYFTDMDRAIPGQSSTYFLRNTLEDFETQLQVSNHMRYYTKEHHNLIKYYFGGAKNTPDVGFFRDMGGRIRVSYDTHMLSRSEPLVKDLLEHADPEQYVISRFKNGMIQFVLNKDLADALVDKFGNEQTLANRWNNDRVVFTGDFNVALYSQLENAVDLETGHLVSPQYLFGLEGFIEKK